VVKATDGAAVVVPAGGAALDICVGKAIATVAHSRTIAHAFIILFPQLNLLMPSPCRVCDVD
jgi:hypothetical protein